MNVQLTNILLVEDDEVEAMALKRAFKQQKIENPIIVAKDGLQALATLRGEDGCQAIERPYIILLDLNMPRMNGIELLDELRADADLRDSVVFVLTTSATEEDKVKAYKFNVAGYMVKSDVGEKYNKVIAMLNAYWDVVALP